MPDRRQAAWTTPALLLIELLRKILKEIEKKSFHSKLSFTKLLTLFQWQVVTDIIYDVVPRGSLLPGGTGRHLNRHLVVVNYMNPRYFILAVIDLKP